MIKFICTENGKLVKTLLAQGVSYAAARKALRKKDVKINGKRTGSDLNVRAGDEIVVYAEPGEKKFYEELYSDENVLIVYKYAGVASEELFARLSERGDFRFVHRLDRNTDGVMIFGRNDAAERALLKGFRERAFGKYYLAEVYGRMPAESGVFTDYLVKDADSFRVKISAKPAAGAARIVTGYKVLEERAETSLVEVELFTGKTHQIRAHLAFHGNFVIGDGKYGKESINRKMGAKSQRLTAYKLILRFADGPLGYLDGKITEIQDATGRFHA